MNRPMQRIAFLAFALGTAAVLGASSWAVARTNFDGNWSVEVLTDRGTCDRGYRYEIQVEDGALLIRGEGSGSIDITGRVDAGGAVKVSIQRGQQVANGTGRLSRDSGSGTWNGHTTSSECSGVWTAERR